MKRKKIKEALLLLLLLGLLGGCGKTETSPKQEQKEIEETQPSKDEAQRGVKQRSAWCVYWDGEAVWSKPERLSKYDALVLFGCIYEKDASLYIPPQLEALYQEFPVQEPETRIYLSFINDVMQEDGTAVQKSPEFLAQVLKDETLGNRLIEDMIAQTKAWGLDGVELDYENIDKQENLWEPYLDFVARLAERTKEEGLLLRVVLGAYAPVEGYSFPSGPEYVVMCYNLYGTHGEPGPKADAAFLKQMTERYAAMEVTFALANGGFEWDASGKALRSLTAAQAEELERTVQAKPVREESGALCFTYPAEDGTHTVWYGDEQTLEHWEKVLLENSDTDIRVALWRME